MDSQSGPLSLNQSSGRSATTSQKPKSTALSLLTPWLIPARIVAGLAPFWDLRISRARPGTISLPTGGVTGGVGKLTVGGGDHLAGAGGDLTGVGGDLTGVGGDLTEAGGDPTEDGEDWPPTHPEGLGLTEGRDTGTRGQGNTSPDRDDAGADGGGAETDGEGAGGHRTENGEASSLFGQVHIRWTGDGDTRLGWETGTRTEGAAAGGAGVAGDSRPLSSDSDPDSDSQTGSELGNGVGEEQLFFTRKDPPGDASAPGVASSAEWDTTGADVDTGGAAFPVAKLTSLPDDSTGTVGLVSRPGAELRGAVTGSRAAGGDFSRSQSATICPEDPHHRQVPSLLRQSRNQ